MSTATYAYYNDGDTTFGTLREFLRDWLGGGGATKANRDLWTMVLRLKLVVPIHNGTVDVHTSSFLLEMPVLRGDESDRIKTLGQLMLDVSKDVSTHLQMPPTGFAIIVTPSNTQATWLQDVLDTVYTVTDQTSPTFNRVVLRVDLAQAEHQDSNAGADVNVVISMNASDNPTSVRQIYSRDYPVRSPNPMIKPTEWHKFPWIPMPRSSVARSIEAARKSAKRGKTKSEGNCFGAPNQGPPAVAFRSSLPHRGTPSPSGSLRLAWFQTWQDRSEQETGAIFNNKHGNDNYATWLKRAKDEAKDARSRLRAEAAAAAAAEKTAAAAAARNSTSGKRLRKR